MTTVIGAIFTSVSFLIPDFIGSALIFVVGLFCLFGAVFRACFHASIFVPESADEIIVQYGFFLSQTRLVLDRQNVAVDYQTGAETSLSGGWRGFKIISLRHVETEEVAYLGYTIKSEDALGVFDALSQILAEGGRNYTQAAITLKDGSQILVDRLATWEAGHKRKYRSQLTVVDRNTVEIKRKAFGENRKVVDRTADVYPVRIESDETVRLIYSNDDEKSIRYDDCIALQFCKEEIAERSIRYEVNLIVDSSDDNRINLMSFDLQPHKTPDQPRRAAEQLGELLDLEVMEHL